MHGTADSDYWWVNPNSMALHSGNSLRVYHAKKKKLYRFRIKALGYVGNMQE